ncbi:MAG: hypothetical protein ACI845_000636 [Gammaproteobacteria bacterium]
MLKEKASLDDIPILQKGKTVIPIHFYQAKYNDEKLKIYQTCRSGGHTLKEIGEHYTTISRIVKSIEMRFGRACKINCVTAHYQ